MSDLLRIEYIPLSKARRWDKNPKKHDIGAICQSITRYGFVDPPKYDPVLNSGTGGLVYGNGRDEALVWMQAQGDPLPRGIAEDSTTGEWCMPVIFGVDAASLGAAEALAVDHNNLTMAGGDFTALDMSKMWGDGFADVLSGLSELGELPITFDSDDLVGLLATLPEPGAGGDEFDATPEEGETRTQLGQLWAIGPHRLLVGDCTVAENVARLMGGERAALCVTDPPYAVDYDPQWRVGLGGGGTQEYASGDKIVNDTSLDWLPKWQVIPADVLYVWFEAKASIVLQMHLEALDYIYLYEIIWNKDSAAFGRGDYHWKHEKCLYLAKRGKPHNYQGDRSQNTVWDIPTIQSFKNGHDVTEWGIQGHGNQKPMECMQRPIENNTKDDDLVYDPFLGSGTTLIAAHRTGRRCYGMEISPKYCDVILRRAEAEGLECALVD